MNYVGIVLISHSEKVVTGIKEITKQVIQDVPVFIAGGTDDGDIGTSVGKISEALEKASSGKGVLVFYDLGSAKMNAELAIELSGKDDIEISEAPLLEGAYVAIVESNIGKSKNEIIEGLNKSFPKADSFNH